MKPFLERLAVALLEHHRHELGRIAVVLPSKRAGIHLRKYLAQHAGTTIWCPELLDLGGFMQHVTGLRQADQLELLFLLHTVHVQLAKDRAEPMDRFLQWAPTTLRDMSEVDAHLIDHDDLYRDLRSFHEIESWSYRLGPLSPGQERQVHHWTATGDLHRAMHQHMEALKAGTSGYIAKTAARNIDAIAGRRPWEQVWFAGLNALEPASVAVIAGLQRHGIARVAWDADRHYLQDELQEAGRYLRRAMKTLGPGELAPLDTIRGLPRQFTSVAVPNDMAMVRYAAQVLQQTSASELERTAIVLADEDLLLPLMGALPSALGPVNVTMGIPLHALPVGGLVDAVLELHGSLNDHDDRSLTVVEKLLLHPFLHEGQATTRLLTMLREKHRSWISSDDIVRTAQQAGSEACDHLERVLTRTDGHTERLAERVLAAIQWAKERQPNDRFIVEQLFHMARSQRQFDARIRQAAVGPLDARSYIMLRSKLLQAERIDLFGEPLAGVQIMGLLETRAIDHERVIVLGANEGRLPRTGGHQSWIPFDIRRTYRLPLPADAEAIGAYHFHRLVQLASSVELVHGGSGSDGPKEPSRFIAQWRHELQGKSQTTVVQRMVAARTSGRHAPSITVPKTPAVMEKLRAMADRGLSPTALGIWLRCPMDLYFQQVLRVRPLEEVDGRLGSDVLGEAVHAVLEKIYTEMPGGPLHASALREASTTTRDRLIAVLRQEHHPGTLARGHFRLRIEMAAKALTDHLLSEAERCEHEGTEILGLEQVLAGQLRPGIRLQGRTDRIERRNGLVHVLDLKTGNVPPEDLKLKSLDRSELRPKHRYAIQLMVYAWASLVQHPEWEHVRAGVIPLQRPSQSEGLYLKLAGSDLLGRDQLPAIEALLAGIADEILDPSVPFRHDPESEWCSCCVG